MSRVEDHSHRTLVGELDELSDPIRRWSCSCSPLAHEIRPRQQGD